MKFRVGDEVILNSDVDDRWIREEVEEEGFVVEDTQEVLDVSKNGRIEINLGGYWLQPHNFALVHNPVHNRGEQNERL